MTTVSLPRNLQEIQARARKGEQFEYLFFWGHQPAKDNQVNESCLSQWYVAPFVVDGLVYPTAEHWMMAEKARLFGDATTLEQILAAPSPKSAKTLGRKVQNFDLAVWVAHCRDIVTRGNVEKFQQHASLREFLLSTAGKVIVEASPSDRIWGIGLRQSDERALDPRRWLGQNLLGFALMDVRNGC
jgi:ribA/ribD-fused uncharacterized protein